MPSSSKSRTQVCGTWGSGALPLDGTKKVLDKHKIYVIVRIYCGVEKWSSRQSHKLEIVGSNPTLPQPNLPTGWS